MAEEKPLGEADARQPIAQDFFGLGQLFFAIHRVHRQHPSSGVCAIIGGQRENSTLPAAASDRHPALPKGAAGTDRTAQAATNKSNLAAGRKVAPVSSRPSRPAKSASAAGSFAKPCRVCGPSNAGAVAGFVNETSSVKTSSDDDSVRDRANAAKSRIQSEKDFP
jgi:hypothetical protein